MGGETMSSAAAGGGGAGAATDRGGAGAAKRQRMNRPFHELLSALGDMHAEEVSPTDPTNSLLDQLRKVQTSGGGGGGGGGAEAASGGADAAGGGAIYQWTGYTPPEVATDGVSSKTNIARDAFNFIVLGIKRAIGRVAGAVPHAMRVTGLQAGFNASGVNTNIWLQMCVDMFMEMSIGEKLQLPFLPEEVSAMRRDIRINLKNTKAFFKLAPQLAKEGPHSDGMQNKLTSCFQSVRKGKAGNKEQVTADRVTKVTAIFDSFHKATADLALYSSLCEAVGKVFGKWADVGPAIRTRQAKIYREGRLHLHQKRAKYTDQWFETYYITWNRVAPLGPKRPSVQEAARREVTALVERRLQLRKVAGTPVSIGGEHQPQPGSPFSVPAGAATGGSGIKVSPIQSFPSPLPPTTPASPELGVALPPQLVALPPPPPLLQGPLPVHISTMFVASASAGTGDISWDSFTPEEEESPEENAELVYVSIDGGNVLGNTLTGEQVSEDLSLGGGDASAHSASEAHEPEAHASESDGTPSPYSFYSAASLFDVNLGSLTINSLSEYERDNMEFSKDHWIEQERLIFAMHWFLDEASELLGGRGEEDGDATDASEFLSGTDEDDGDATGAREFIGAPSTEDDSDTEEEEEEEEESGKVYKPLQMLMQQGHLLGEMIRVASVNEQYCKMYYNKLRRKTREADVYARLNVQGAMDGSPGVGTDDTQIEEGFLEGLTNVQCYCRSHYVRDMWRRSRVLMQYAALMLTGIDKGLGLIAKVLQSAELKGQGNLARKLTALTAPALADLEYTDHARPSETLVEAYEENVQTIYEIGQDTIEIQGIEALKRKWLATLNGDDSNRLLDTAYKQLQENYGSLYSGETYGIGRTVLVTVDNALIEDAKQIHGHNDSKVHSNLAGPMPGKAAMAALRKQLEAEALGDAAASAAASARRGLLRPVHRATRPLQLQPLYRRFHSSLKF